MCSLVTGKANAAVQVLLVCEICHTNWFIYCYTITELRTDLLAGTWAGRFRQTLSEHSHRLPSLSFLASLTLCESLFHPCLFLYLQLLYCRGAWGGEAVPASSNHEVCPESVGAWPRRHPSTSHHSSTWSSILLCSTSGLESQVLSAALCLRVTVHIHLRTLPALLSVNTLHSWRQGEGGWSQHRSWWWSGWPHHPVCTCSCPHSSEQDCFAKGCLYWGACWSWHRGWCRGQGSRSQERLQHCCSPIQHRHCNAPATTDYPESTPAGRPQCSWGRSWRF